MRTRYTSDKYLKTLRNRLLRAQSMKLEAAKAIMAAALEVKQVEKYLQHIRSQHTLTEAEKHQLVLAEDTKDKLIDVAARFEANITDQMLNEIIKTKR